MPLTNDELAHLHKALTAELRIASPKHKTMLRLAFEHLSDMGAMQSMAMRLLQGLEAERDASLCYRVPAFFKKLYARVRLWR